MVKIVHAEDDPMNGTLILAISWHLPEKCQVEGCENDTAAIMCLTAEESPTGSAMSIAICEEHYQKGVHEEKFNEKVIL